MPQLASRVIRSYDTDRYPFETLVQLHLGLGALSRVHTFTGPPADLPARFDQGTLLHRIAYEQAWPAVAPVYARFMREVVLPTFPTGDYYFQRVPTFRFHLPGGKATGEFHRDRDYGHPPETINVLVPLTRMTETGSMWVESAPDAGDYAPVDLHVGEYLVFDGANCRHGSYPNRTGRTRVSFDARVCPTSALPTDGRRTAAAGLAMAPGAYYSNRSVRVEPHLPRES